MERQCAWCLRFMDRSGEPISTPQPKQYKASHGMCRACGSLWLERALSNPAEQDATKKLLAVCEATGEEITEISSKM
jgi:hypothetical protein